MKQNWRNARLRREVTGRGVRLRRNTNGIGEKQRNGKKRRS